MSDPEVLSFFILFLDLEEEDLWGLYPRRPGENLGESNVARVETIHSSRSSGLRLTWNGRNENRTTAGAVCR
jgi:hypothetical protein